MFFDTIISDRKIYKTGGLNGTNNKNLRTGCSRIQIHWQEIYRLRQSEWFDMVEKMTDLKRDYDDSDSYIGLMRRKHNEEFEYWIGIFMPKETKVSEGFSYIDFPKSRLGVCWIYGQERDLYMHEDECAKELKKNGFEIIADEKGACWFFERYGCPRFTTPDDNGNIILDICYYIK